MTATTLLQRLVLSSLGFIYPMSGRYSTNCDHKGWPGSEIQMYTTAASGRVCNVHTPTLTMNSLQILHAPGHNNTFIQLVKLLIIFENIIHNLINSLNNNFCCLFQNNNNFLKKSISFTAKLRIIEK